MMLCIGIALFSMFYFLTQFLQNIQGWSAVKTGVGFLPMTAGIIVAAGLTSHFVGKTGIRAAADRGTGDVGGGACSGSRASLRRARYLEILDRW